MQQKITNNSLKKKKSKLETTVFIIIFIILLFFGDDARIIVKHISSFSKNILVFITLFIFFIFDLLIKYYKNYPREALLSFFMFFLFYVFYILSTLFNDMWYGWVGNTTSILICAFGIILFSRISFEQANKIINKINLFFVLIIFFQVLTTSLDLLQYYNIFSQLYKMKLVIPIGASNSIAIILTPILLSIIYKSKKEFYDYFIIFIIFLTLILIMNRSSFFVILIILICKSADTFFKRIKINYNLLILILFIVFILIINFNSVKTFLFSFLFNRINNGILTLNSFSSGRIDILLEKLEKIKLSPFIGYGAGYQNSESDIIRAHNLIFELLERSGIIGFLLYSIALFIPLKRIVKYRHNSELIERVFFMLVSVLLMSLLEPGLLSPKTDFLFGSILGIGISLSYKNNISKINC